MTKRELEQRVREMEARLRLLEARPVYVPVMQPLPAQPAWPTISPNYPWPNIWCNGNYAADTGAWSVSQNVQYINAPQVVA